ncbi:Lipoxygenase-4 [Dactylellina cionopaga]|nr:Lipoxygenase-4 [Dactylellina cionopaga]
MRWFEFVAISAVSVVAAPLSQRDALPRALLPPFSLPGAQPLSSTLRAAGIATKRATFKYSPGVDGGPSSPAGVLGEELVAADSALTDVELTAEVVVDTADLADASVDAAVAKYNGLKTLDDYTKLYDGNWEASSSPTGVMPGMLTNYTQDLLFSMERLSLNPYAVRRLIPGQDALPFQVDDATISSVAGKTLSTLLSEGRLFYADHRAQAALPTTANFVAACDAYFYISPTSGEFLPLAIRTNLNSNLIYTPADSADDWLLAKMMYNCDDFFMGQFNHLAATHYVAEVAFQAAVRTLSDDHPVFGIFKRLMYGAFGIRPLAVVVLLRPGGSIDQFFGHTGKAAGAFSLELYNNGFAGAVQGNYFLTNLKRRGLIVDPSVGPALKDFPFYEDALPIYNAIHDFVTSFVNSYYANDAAVVGDPELQAWLVEANGPAGSIDFPTAATMKTRAQLVDLLTHLAHLVSSAHHTVNTNNLLTGGGVLPFNPSALYKKIPTTKGASNLAQYLPPVLQSLQMIQNQAFFSRPLLAGTDRSIVHMFDDAVMLSRMNSATRNANDAFKTAMLARSQVVKSRTFDAQGLSQGMPFVWKSLDPDVAPFSLTI